MKKVQNDKSFNDRLVSKTVIPAIYLWLLASGAVVAMGIWKPDVVLENLDGFIALIAIISGVAAPALSTVLRMWENEQQIEIDNIPNDMNLQRELEAVGVEHQQFVDKLEQVHRQNLETLDQEHQHSVEKHTEGLIANLKPIIPIGDEE